MLFARLALQESLREESRRRIGFLGRVGRCRDAVARQLLNGHGARCIARPEERSPWLNLGPVHVPSWS